MTKTEQTHPQETTSAGLKMRWPWLVLLVAVWTIEVFLVQRHVYSEGGRYPFGLVPLRPITQFCMDATFCSLLVVVLPRFWVYLVFGLSSIWSAVLLTYFNYFGHALTFSTIRYQLGEGAAVADSFWSHANTQQIVLLLAALAIKIGLRTRLPQKILARSFWRQGLYPAMCGALLVLILANYALSLGNLRGVWNVEDLGQIYGFSGAALGEYLYLDQSTLLAKAQEAAQTTYNRLTAVETPLDPGRHVAIVQVESLDVAALSATIDGWPVMPFLSKLKDQCMYYQVRAIHSSGSSDADFVMLENHMPLGVIAPFKVVDFPFENGLPRHIVERGYACSALHGNAGNFFERRKAYERTGFDELFFREELEEEGLPLHRNLIPDADLFLFSAKRLLEADRPMVHFIITVTSHTPFHFTPPPDDTPFKTPRNEGQRYLNSMRYVDDALRSYIDALPEGTLVIFYGDHDSHATYLDHQQFEPEIVPVLIFRKGEDLSKQQKTRGSRLATSGKLNLLDVAGYVWSWFDDRAT